MLVVWLAGCGHPEPPRPAEPTAPPEPVSVAEPTEPSEPPPETAEPPPDPRALAEGRPLASPGPEGFLSTWRVGEEVVAFPSWRMELADAAPAGSDAITLSATLLVPRDTHAWVMVGMRGAAEISLDGEALGRVASPDRFHRDWGLVRLPLAAGERALSVRFEKPERGAWRGAVRLLSARVRPGPGAVAITYGELDEATQVTLRQRSVALDETRGLGDEGPEVRLRLHRPGGGLEGAPSVVIDGETLALEAPLERAWAIPDRGLLDVTALVGEREARPGRRHLISDRRALAAAAELREALGEAPEGARAPIAWRIDELTRVVREHDGDQAWRNVLQADARRITRSLARDRDPFARIRGYERMAFFSRLDGTAQEYELFVPPAYRDSRAWPVLITLHGYKGNAGDYFRNTFGLARDYEGGETLLGHGRTGEAPRQGPMIVVAPTGRGQAYYRHAGEVDVMEALADVEARFRIDPRRVYITGGSMGGTGAAYLPYRHPDRFAAAAALAGYHDQRVRQDTDHHALGEVERFLVAHRSDVDWAENGLHLPTLLVRGTRDRPLEWTRVLARRLDALDYPHEHREPELGHNVWTETYAGGAIFDWLGRHRRPEAPSHVRLRTARERTRAAYWVRLEAREAADAFAEVDARLDGATVEASITGARAVTFSPEVEGPLTVVVDGQRLTGASPLTLERADARWRVSTAAWPAQGSKREGVSGPIRDVYHEPLVFVIGTQDPDHTLINRLVAAHWARPKGWIVDYPIVDDVDVTGAMIRERTLVLVGPPHSNAVHARMADRLPIRVGEEAVTVGDTRHAGAQVGAVFVAPSPLAPERAVLVIAGPRPLGTWRSLALPDILPDYVVYDERVGPARGQWACGGTGCEYRSHGFFTMDWALPR